MVEITYATLQGLASGASGLEEETCEAIIDQAVNEINLYVRDDLIPNMTGTAGDKSLNVESRVAGGVMRVAMAIYNNDYKEPENTAVQGLSVSKTNIQNIAKDVARHLKEMEVSYG